MDLIKNKHWVPKFKVGKQIIWEHHRSGWKFVLDLIKENFHDDGGVRFIGSVEDEVSYGEKTDEPWVGFIHQVPQHNYPWFPDLERLLQDDVWKYNLKSCLGLYVLCDYLKKYLIDNQVHVPINMIYYPVPDQELLFDISLFNNAKRVLHSGEFLRNYQAFFDLEAPGYEKIFLHPTEFEPTDFQLHDTIIYDRVSDDEYDRLLQKSILFLNLYDAPANTAIVECIARNTPVLVNKLPGVIEYLGKDYPFYYEDLAEAKSKLSNIDLIAETSEYLKNAGIKPKLTAPYFIDSIRKGSIYRTLPIPIEKIPELTTFDVSVVICSYKRTYNFEQILEQFMQQDFTGTFEVYIWNNNATTHDELRQIYEKYKDKLNLKLINSTENFYCIIRAGIASLTKSDLMLFCDDDVIPSRNYISFFLEKYKQYGKESVICLRGHKFYPHTLNEEDPELAWLANEDVVFCDENCEDMQIHYAHADNLLIPKELMLRLNNYKMDDYSKILIDDYWFSYILSFKLNIPIWKVAGKDIMRFTECESNPDIAMYLNVKVRDQLLSFYVSHMNEGWPYANSKKEQAIQPQQRQIPVGS